MKGSKNLCLDVNDLRAIAQVNKIALKLKEMEKLSKIRKELKMNETNTKDDLMSLCRDENEIYDCGMCEYEFTDTCNLRLEEIKKN